MKNKRLLSCIFVLVLLLSLIPLQAMAAGDIDLTTDVSLTIVCEDSGVPLENVKFDIYLVATTDEKGNLTMTDDFAGYHVNLRGKDTASMLAEAATLDGYVQRDKIAPTDTDLTDNRGATFFPETTTDLKPGIYLVRADRFKRGSSYYDISPCIVSLPTIDPVTSDWSYAVTAKMKFTRSGVPSEPTTTNIKAIKAWEDNGFEDSRPQEVVVQLLCDGEIYDTVSLNAAGNWRYEWKNLDADHVWMVVEKVMDDYNVTVVREGTTFIVTNTCTKTPPNKPDNPNKPDKPNLPQTGQLWWPVPVLLICGLVFAVVGLYLRKRKKDEES